MLRGEKIGDILLSYKKQKENELYGSMLDQGLRNLMVSFQAMFYMAYEKQ